MSDFAVVIGFKFENEEYRSVLLDTVDDVRVNGTASITEQPLVSGDVISDHMYNQPKTMNISGTLSMNDSKITVIDGQGSKLANFQELFERIQREGVRCDIIKISVKNEDDIRFLHRQNMVIASHGWTEKINSIDYSLAFKEVMLAETVSLDVDTDDQYLPNITEPNTLSFTDTLLDWDEIDKSIIKILQDNDLISERFWNSLKGFGKEQLVGIVGSAVALILVHVLISGPVGWILGAMVAVAIQVYFFIKGLINLFKRWSRQSKYKVKRFDYTKNEKKMKSEIKRLGDLVADIHNEFEQVNKLFHVYQISQDTPQECMINVGDNYYIFTFTKNNLDGKYGLQVEDMKGNKVAAKNNVTSAPLTFDQLNNSNQLFIADNNSNIYIIYNPIKEETEEAEATAEPDDNNLKNYSILVCDMNIEKFQKLIDKIIKSKILKDYS